MGFNYRKSIRVGKKSLINLSKSGVGFSFAAGLLRLTKTAKGSNRMTMYILGTGISCSKTVGKKKKEVFVCL